jgi:hypothetical protein
MPLANTRGKIPYRYTRVLMWFGIKIKVSKKRIRRAAKLIYELKLNGLEELIMEY